MLLCKLAISQKIETGSTCSCWCSWVFLGPRATRRLHFSQHWILNLERHLSEPQGSSAGINTSMAMREGLVPQLARFSDPEGPFPTSVWAAAMLTISLLHTLWLQCLKSQALFFYFSSKRCGSSISGQAPAQTASSSLWLSDGVCQLFSFINLC